MKRSAILLLVLSLSFGCATPPHQGEKGEKIEKVEKTEKSAGFLQHYTEKRRLASAVALLEKGDVTGSTRVMEEICSGVPVPGVTDEALFRLALLSLKPNGDRPVSAQGHHYLKRLKKEYPSSPWTLQAAPIAELIGSVEELRRQNKNYRSSNQSLTKEVNELNKNISELSKNIEQLKHLDLEIEKNTR